MNQTRLKIALLGTVVAVVLAASASESKACAWGRWGCAPSWGGCYSVCDPCYGGCYGGYYGGWRAYRAYRWCAPAVSCCYTPVVTVGCWDSCWTPDCCGTLGASAAPSMPTPAPTPAPKTPAPPAVGPGMPPAPAPGGTTQIDSPTDTSTILTIWVPADAKVTINGLPTRSLGSKRQYVSFGLKPGFSYKYEIKAQIVRDGQMVEDTRTVSLNAGQRGGVAFGFNSPTSGLAANN